jgi:hypothetical protein
VDEFLGAESRVLSSGPPEDAIALIMMIIITSPIRSPQPIKGAVSLLIDY